MRLLICLIVIAFLIVVIVSTYERNIKTLKAIATTNNYTLVSYNERYMSIGPYYYKDRSQHIFRAIYSDKDGNQYIAWVRTPRISSPFNLDGYDLEWEHESK